MAAPNRSTTPTSARKKAQVALQKAVTAKLMTPGSTFEGLQGPTADRFNGTSVVFNDKPGVLVEGAKFHSGPGSFGMEGYVPNTIQLGGTTLYGLQQGNNVVFSPKTKTPLMESFKPKIKTTVSDPDSTPPPSSGPRLDPNATEQYASNFKAGEANKDAMQDYFKGQKNGENLAKWAEENPALAYKAYTKGVAKEQAQDQRDLMSDYRVMNQDVSKGEDFNKAEFDAIHGGKGGSVEVDIDGSGIGAAKINPQGFKDDAMTALLTNFGNTDVEPFVKDMALPTTTNYAGAFNQTDVPDLQSMMNMGEQLGNLGYEGPSFSQSFKDRFQNMMLGK